MNFIEKLKDQIDHHRCRGRSEVVVDRKSLNELIYHFESLDSEARAKYYYESGASTEEILVHSLQALHRKHEGNNDPALLLIADTLSPLIKESLKRKSYMERINRSCTTGVIK